MEVNTALLAAVANGREEVVLFHAKPNVRCHEPHLRSAQLCFHCNFAHISQRRHKFQVDLFGHWVIDRHKADDAIADALNPTIRNDSLNAGATRQFLEDNRLHARLSEHIRAIPGDLPSGRLLQQVDLLCLMILDKHATSTIVVGSSHPAIGFETLKPGAARQLFQDCCICAWLGVHLYTVLANDPEARLLRLSDFALDLCLLPLVLFTGAASTTRATMKAAA
mmetsp:Transcript_43102/g.108334  ORF Transcript_43102/g.108334 Transcript_43102/m.108334 type:complete len:223 (-) Transcript_43102:15-683(-)